MITTIVLIVLALIAAALLYAASRPDTFRIQRAIVIRAKPDNIFPHINDLHQWAHWSPWASLDPAMQNTFSGADSGLGAAYAWQGNNKVGVGSMEIIESTPPTKIGIKLDFIKPFAAHNTAEFKLAAQGETTTTVTWVMSGPNNYVGKLMGLCFNMDKIVGGQFEQGLASLKDVVEG